MALEDVLGTSNSVDDDIDPQSVVSDLMRAHGPAFNDYTAVDPQAVLNRLIRKHLSQEDQQRPQRPSARQQQPAADFSQFGKTEDEVKATPQEDFSQFGQPAEAEKPEAKPGEVGGALSVGARKAAQGLVGLAGGTIKGAAQQTSALTPSMVQTAGGEGVPLSVEDLTPPPAEPVEKNPVLKRVSHAGEAITQWGKSTFPVSEAEEKAHPIASTVGGAIGGVVAPLAMGLIDPPAGIVAGAAMFGLSGASETYDDAKKHGADEATAQQAASLSGAVNAALGLIPVGNVLKPITKYGTQASSLAVRILAQAGENGVVFASVGEAQHYIGQQIAKTYDPKAGYEFDVNRLLGELIAGGALGAVHGAFSRGATPPATQEEETTPPNGRRAGLPPPGGGAGEETPPPPPPGGPGPSPGAGADATGRARTAPPEPPPPFESSLKPKTRRTLEERAAYYKEFSADEIKSWSDDKLKDYVNTKFGFGSRPHDDDVGGTYAAAEDILRRAGHTDEDIAGMSPKDRAEAVDEALRSGVHAGAEPETPGTRAAPVDVETSEDVARAAAAASTDHTPAQGEANNVPRGHMRWNGLDITIETPAGGTRRGLNPETGEAWETQHPHAYGYIRGIPADGGDGQHPDITMGDHPTAPTVYVIDELDNKTGQFRQTKSFGGFQTWTDAAQSYLGISSKDRSHMGGMRAFPVDEFVALARSGGLGRPVSDAMYNVSGDLRAKMPGEKPGRKPGEIQAEQPLSGAGKSATTGGEGDAHEGAPLEGEVLPPEHPRARDGAVRQAPEIEGEITPEHHAAVEEALTAAGVDPHEVRPADIARAAEIHAEEGHSPSDAFQLAVVRNAVDDGALTPKQVKDIYGDQISAFVAARPAPQRQLPAPSRGAAVGGEAPAAAAQPAGIVPGGGEGRPSVSAGTEAPGREGEAAGAIHPEERPGAGGGAASGERAPAAHEGAAQSEADLRSADLPALREYARGVVGDEVKSVHLVGSMAAKGEGKDVDLIYDLGERKLPRNSDEAGQALEAVVERTKIDTSAYDTFLKSGDRYFHISMGAGPAIVENSTYAADQAGKPIVELAKAPDIAKAEIDAALAEAKIPAHVVPPDVHAAATDLIASGQADHPLEALGAAAVKFERDNGLITDQQLADAGLTQEALDAHAELTAPQSGEGAAKERGEPAEAKGHAGEQDGGAAPGAGARAENAPHANAASPHAEAAGTAGGAKSEAGGAAGKFEHAVGAGERTGGAKEPVLTRGKFLDTVRDNGTAEHNGAEWWLAFDPKGGGFVIKKRTARADTLRHPPETFRPDRGIWEKEYAAQKAADLAGFPVELRIKSLETGKETTVKTPTEDESSKLRVEMAEKDEARKVTGDWWKDELTPHGREMVTDAAGLPKRIAKMVWHAIHPEVQDKIGKIKGTDADPSKIAEAPTWAEVMSALPKDAKGRPDLDKAADLMHEISGKKNPSYRDLTPSQQTEMLAQAKDAGAQQRRWADAASGRTEIGKNENGQTLYEDQRGVRSYIENGVRLTEAVPIRPTRAGVEAVKPEHKGEWRLAEPHPTRPDLKPEVGRATIKAEADHGNQSPVPPGDARAGAEDVQAPEQGGGTGARGGSGIAAGGENAAPVAGGRAEGQERPSEPAGPEGSGGEGAGGPIGLPGFRDHAGTGRTGVPDEAGPAPAAAVEALDPVAKSVLDAAAKNQAIAQILRRIQAGETFGEATKGGFVDLISLLSDNRLFPTIPTGEAFERAAKVFEAGKPAEAAKPDASVTGQNHVIAPGTLDEGRSARAKAQDNVRAIELVRAIEAEGRPATKAEQEELARYVGWGGIKGAFPDSDGKFGKGFEAIGEKLKTLLDPEEYATARRSIQYAHYTAENVVRAMWDAAKRLGFKGGSVFEPGMGVGNFAGMRPDGLHIQYTGMELDHTTAQIAKLLYPQFAVRQADLTRVTLPEGHFDLAIGNPPFADVAIKSDPKYAKHGFFLHDYFFAKSLDAVRPGGVVAFISSAGTMNKVNPAAREYLADRAELVGAIRLPSNAFAKNAGTEVTTDIVFLRKRLPDEAAGDRTWTETVEVELPDKTGQPTRGAVNRYFAEHPEMVLGEQGFFDKLYLGRYAVHGRKGQDLAKDLAEAVERLPAEVMRAAEAVPQAPLDFKADEKKDGSFYIGPKGQLYQTRGGAGVPVSRRGAGVEGGRTAAEIERIRALVPMRDALRKVYAADLAEDGASAAAARRDLNKSYDDFVRQYGPINKADLQFRRPTSIQAEVARAEAREEARYAGLSFDEGTFDPTDMVKAGATTMDVARARKEAREAAKAKGRPWDEGSFDPDDMPDVVIDKRPNIDPFMDDPESYRLRAIERYDDATGKAEKSRVFTESAISRPKPPEIKSINDAVLHTLNQRGRLDIPEIARLVGKSEAEAIEALGDRVFRDPGSDHAWVTRDEYLSENVRKKLALAKAEAERNPEYRRNVEALEASQPTPLGPSQIHATLGMPWIPENTVAEFALKDLGLESLKVRYEPSLAQWFVQGDTQSAAASTTWGTDRRRAPELISDALNRQIPKIYDTHRNPDGTTERVLNKDATQAAQEKLQALKDKFSGWIWNDPDRVDHLAGLYNEHYNNLVSRQYDGAYLTTPGVSSDWSWRPHQKRVISRIIQSGNTYMAHAVGAGKTSAMIGAGMEMRRLGLVRKPMYAVPNHMLAQFAKEFYEQYPTARIAVADERRFHTDRRKQFIANVAADDLDAVIITHSALGMIPISDAFGDKVIRDQIDAYREVLNNLPKDHENRITRSRIEKQIERLEQRLAGRSNKKRDQVFTFEEMGVDFLFVDEAHLFRKLDFATNMGQMKGIDPEGSQAAWDLYVKTLYLDTVNPGRSLVLASGTPVTNTMAELFTVSRYLQPKELGDRGLARFDAWAGAFGEPKAELEQDAAGGYKTVARFARFVNVPELSAMVRQNMDVVTSKQLEQYVVRPKLAGGKRIMNLAEKTPALERYQRELAQRMKDIEKRKGPPKKGDDIMLAVINDGRHAAIDMRLVYPDARKTTSKLELLVDNVHRIWKETKRQKFYKAKDGAYDLSKPVDVGPATQMIFANLGLSGKRGFSVPDYIRAELVRRGVPKAEIAFMADYKTHAAKQKLFNDMNEGKVRVLIGSTAKMATGVNAQRRLIAIHNQDPLWFPSDDEQRNGRGLRQGNLNPEIQIHDYSTKGTYDSTMWGMMERKARFIQAFFEGDPTLRDMDDLGEVSQYEQAKAITTNDPRLIKLTELRQELEKAERRAGAFDQELYALRGRRSSARGEVKYYNERVAATELDIAKRKDISGDKFMATVGKTHYGKRADFADALLALIEKQSIPENVGKHMPVGEIGGFPIEATYSKFGGYQGRPQTVEATGLYLKLSGNFERGIRITASGLGMTRSMEDNLRGLESDLADYREKIAKSEKFLAESEGASKATFKGDDAIEALRTQVRALEAELAAPPPEAQPVATDPATISSLDELQGHGRIGAQEDWDWRATAASISRPVLDAATRDAVAWVKAKTAQIAGSRRTKDAISSAISGLISHGGGMSEPYIEPIVSGVVHNLGTALKLNEERARELLARGVDAVRKASPPAVDRVLQGIGDRLRVEAPQGTQLSLGRRKPERMVSGTMAGVSYKITETQNEALKAARKAGAGRAEIERMVAEFEGKGPSEQQGNITAIEDRIRQAFRDIAGHPAQDAVRLNDLRARLPDVPRADVDAALLAMKKSGEAVLMHLDNPRDIAAVGDAALRGPYDTYHTLWLERSQARLGEMASGAPEGAASVSGPDREGFREITADNLTPAAQAKRAELEAAVINVIESMIGKGRVDIRTPDKITMVRSRVQGWGSYRPDELMAGGTSSVADRLIRVAIEDRSGLGPESVAAHEGYHIASALLLSDAERDLVRRQDHVNRRLVAEHLGLTPEEAAGLHPNEVEAVGYELYKRDREAGGSGRGFHIGVRRLFERIRQFFERLRNALRELGFTKPSDVFKDFRENVKDIRESMRAQKQAEGVFSDLYEGKMRERPSRTDTTSENHPSIGAPEAITLYHGTNAKFEPSAFNLSKAKNRYERAVFLTEDRHEAAKFGSNIMEVHIPRNPGGGIGGPGLHVDKGMFDFFARSGDAVQNAIRYARAQYRDYVIFDLPSGKTYAVFNPEIIRPGRAPTRLANQKTQASLGEAERGPETGTEAISKALDKLGEKGNAWVTVPEGEIYLRTGERPEIGRTLEIPNIEFNEEARGKGAFTKYLKEIEDQARNRGFDAVYVEQLFNERLAGFLRRRGYKPEPSALSMFGHVSDQATLYKNVQGYRVFFADEPYRLSDGTSPAASGHDSVEYAAANALESAGNNHAKALREVNEMIGFLHRNHREADRIAHYEQVGNLLQQWKRDKVTLAGEHLTEAEIDAREAAEREAKQAGPKPVEAPKQAAPKPADWENVPEQFERTLKGVMEAMGGKPKEVAKLEATRATDASTVNFMGLKLGAEFKVFSEGSGATMLFPGKRAIMRETGVGPEVADALAHYAGWRKEGQTPVEYAAEHRRVAQGSPFADTLNDRAEILERLSAGDNPHQIEADIAAKNIERAQREVDKPNRENKAFWEKELQEQKALKEKFEGKLLSQRGIEFTPSSDTQFSIGGRARPGAGRPPPRSTRIRDRIGEMLESRLGQKIIEGTQDLSHPVRKLQDELEARRKAPFSDLGDFYTRKRLYPGRVGNETKDFNKAHLDPLVEVMKRNGISLQQAGDYVYAKHVAERNAQLGTLYPPGHQFNQAIHDPSIVGASGQSQNWADKIISDAQRGGKAAAYEDVASRIQAIRKFAVDRMEASGLITPETAETWRKQYKHYVDLRGFEDAPEEAPPDYREPMRFNVRGKEIKQAFGRRSKADNTIVNMLDQAYRTIDRAERNRYLHSVWNALGKMNAESPGSITDIVKLDKGKPKKVIDSKTGLVKIVDDSSYAGSPNTVSTKINGIPHHMVFENRDTAEAVKRMSPEGLGMFQCLLNLENKLKALWTHYSPDFLFRHFIFRYPIEGTLNSFEQKASGDHRVAKYIKNGFPFLGTASKAIFAAEKGKRLSSAEGKEMQDYWEEMRKAGGSMTFRSMRDMDLLREHLKFQLQSLQGKPIKTVREKWRRSIEAMDVVTNALDNALRLAAYTSARKQGKTTQQAALIAREATVDFQLKGKWANAIGLWFPFGNVAIQTGARMTKAVYRSKIMRRVFMGTMLAGFMAAAFNYLVGGDDKDGVPFFEKIPEWDRRLNFIILNPFDRDEQGRPTPIKIPMPYNWAFPLTMGHAIGSAVFGKEERRRILGMVARSGLEVLTPFGQEENMAALLAPELSRPAIYLATNKDYAGRPIHINPDFQKGPNAESGRRDVGERVRTGEGWKYIASTVNRWSGGSRTKSGWLDFYPEDYRQIFDYVAGAQFRLAQNLYQTGKSIFEGKTPDATHVPLERVIRGTDYDAADRALRFERQQQQKHPWLH